MSNSDLTPDELAAHLDALLAGESPPPGAETPPVAAARQLVDAPHPELTPEMSARIRAKMHAARQASPTARVVRFPLAAVMRLVAAVAVIALVFSVGHPAMAASLPGEVLYPVKRGLERVELAWAISPLDRAKTHITQAERRIREAQTLMKERGAFDVSLLEDALWSLEQTPDATLENYPDLASRNQTVQIAVGEVLTEALAVDLVAPEIAAAMIVQLPGPSVVVIAPTPSFRLVPTATPTATPTPTATLTPTTTLTPTATDTITPSPEPTPFTAYVVSGANVRNGPGTSFEIIATLPIGASVVVLDQVDDWQRVRIFNGEIGWMASFLLALTPPTIDMAQTGSGTPGAPGAPGTMSGDPDDPAQPGTNPDTINTDPGSDNTACDLGGNACNAPGQTGNTPGLGEEPPPGQGGSPPGQGMAPGRQNP